MTKTTSLIKPAENNINSRDSLETRASPSIFISLIFSRRKSDFLILKKLIKIWLK